MDYEQIYRSEGFGGAFDIGIDIKIASPVGKTEGVKRAARQAAELLEEAITRDFYANDNAAQERARMQRLELLACFPEVKIFVQPIPNGYCSRACCEHLSWYDVTTHIGIIKIGWRKSVIVLDWSKSAVPVEAEELFPNESVTKDGRMIHAWGYEKAREYLAMLFKRVVP